MPNPGVMQILAEAGVRVDRSKNLVYYPAGLVETALKKVPSVYTFCARDPANDLPVGGACGYLFLDGSGLQVLDLESDRVRKSALKDLQQATLVADYLEQVAFLWPVVSAQDCPRNLQSLHELAAQLNYSTKHVQAMTAVDPASAAESDQSQSLRSMAGGRAPCHSGDFSDNKREGNYSGLARIATGNGSIFPVSILGN